MCLSHKRFVCVCVCVCVVCLFFVGISLSHVGNSGLLHGYGTAAARAALPVPATVCSIFMCPNTGMAASIGFF